MQKRVLWRCVAVIISSLGVALLTGCLAIKGGRVKSVLRDTEHHHYLTLTEKYKRLDEIIARNGLGPDIVAPMDPKTPKNNTRAEAFRELTRKDQELEPRLKALETKEPRPRPVTGLEGKPKEEQSKALRNAILSDLIWVADYEYGLLVKEVETGRSQMAFLTDMAVLGASSAGVVFGGEGLKTILAATSAGVMGMRNSINQNFYREKSTEILVTTMNTLRAQSITNLLIGMTNAATHYTMRQGLIDLRAYHEAGTVLSALVSLAQQTAPRATTATESLEELKKRLNGAGPKEHLDQAFAKLAALPEGKTTNVVGAVITALKDEFSEISEAKIPADKRKDPLALKAEMTKVLIQSENNPAKLASLYTRFLAEIEAAIKKSGP